VISKVKTIYSVTFRLFALVWAVYLLASDSDPNNPLFWVAVIIALTPEFQFGFARVIKKRPYEFERAPFVMLLFAVLFVALLLLTNASYDYVVPSVFVVLGFVLYIQWALVTQFDKPINREAVVPKSLTEFDVIHFCEGPSNPFDWALFYYLRKSKLHSAMVCAHAGEWRNEWIFDGSDETEFAEALGLVSKPAGGHGVVVLKEGRVFDVFRNNNRRAKVPLIKIQNSLESRG